MMPGNLYWEPLADAVIAVARYRGGLIDQASITIRAAIAAEEIKARCLAKHYDKQQGRWIEIPCGLDPKWLAFVAYDCPQDSYFRFDLTKAARACLLGVPVNPPEHARDIVVNAARRKELWPDPIAARPAAPRIEADQGAVNQVEVDGQTTPRGDILGPASEPITHCAITAVYDKTPAGEKPPNLNEIIKPVQELLRADGHEMSGRKIRELAADPRHAGRRWKPGQKRTK